MSGYVLGADADFDLDEIWEFIAADNVDAADRWIGKLFEAFEALGQTPGMGHRRGDLTDLPVLFWPVGAYLIVYRAERQPIEIVAVTQGSRDIPAFLSRRVRLRPHKNAPALIRLNGSAHHPPGGTSGGPLDGSTRRCSSGSNIGSKQVCVA